MFERITESCTVLSVSAAMLRKRHTRQIANEEGEINSDSKLLKYSASF